MAATRSRTHRKSSSRSNRLPLLLVGGFVLLLVAALVVAVVLDQQASADDSTPAPDFSLASLSGETVTLADYRGQVVLLNFWASWCPPCKAEMPDLAAYYEQYRDEGFVVVAVNMGEDAQTARSFIEANGFTFPVLLDLSGSVFDRYGSDALPTTYIIGRNGELIKAYPAGMVSRAQLERDVTPLLG